MGPSIGDERSAPTLAVVLLNVVSQHAGYQYVFVLSTYGDHYTIPYRPLHGNQSGSVGVGCSGAMWPALVVTVEGVEMGSVALYWAGSDGVSRKG